MATLTSEAIGDSRSVHLRDRMQALLALAYLLEQQADEQHVTWLSPTVSAWLAEELGHDPGGLRGLLARLAENADLRRTRLSPCQGEELALWLRYRAAVLSQREDTPPSGLDLGQ